VISGFAVAVVKVEVDEGMFLNFPPKFEKSRVENEELEFESKKKVVQRKGRRGMMSILGLAYRISKDQLDSQSFRCTASYSPMIFTGG
jgi:hypothetical protein